MQPNTAEAAQPQPLKPQPNIMNTKPRKCELEEHKQTTPNSSVSCRKRQRAFGNKMRLVTQPPKQGPNFAYRNPFALALNPYTSRPKPYGIIWVMASKLSELAAAYAQGQLAEACVFWALQLLVTTTLNSLGLGIRV